MFGLKPEEIPGVFGTSLVPDTPEAKRRLREGRELIRRGIYPKGLVLELRRRDDGRPLWVEWWYSPIPGGNLVSSMFIDITDRVLMEQEKTRLEDQNAYLLEEIRSEKNFGDIIGGSSGLRKVMQQVQLVAPTDATVLITGESGTGKELIARAIHEQSARSQRALVEFELQRSP